MRHDSNTCCVHVAGVIRRMTVGVGAVVSMPAHTHDSPGQIKSLCLQTRGYTACLRRGQGVFGVVPLTHRYSSTVASHSFPRPSIYRGPSASRARFLAASISVAGVACCADGELPRFVLLACRRVCLCSALVPTGRRRTTDSPAPFGDISAPSTRSVHFAGSLHGSPTSPR